MGDNCRASRTCGGRGAVGAAVVDDDDDVDSEDLAGGQNGPTDEFGLVLGRDHDGHPCWQAVPVGRGLLWVAHVVPPSIRTIPRTPAVGDQSPVADARSI